PRAHRLGGRSGDRRPLQGDPLHPSYPRPGEEPTMKLSSEVLRTETELAERVRALGKEITQEYAGEEVSVLGVLKGGFIFLADLVRHIRLPTEIGFVESVASRRSESVTEVVFSASLRFSSTLRIEGTHLLIVED